MQNRKRQTFFVTVTNRESRTCYFVLITESRQNTFDKMGFSRTGLTHSQTLLPMVEHVLRLTELTPENLDAIAVDVGPGSFTGVRIGVAAVKGLAFAHQIPCVAVSTTQAMAQPFAGLPADATVCCVMDARRRQVYTARYALDADGTLTRLTPDEAITVDELTAALRAERENCGKTEKNQKNP